MYKFYIKGMNDGTDYSSVYTLSSTMPDKSELSKMKINLMKRCGITPVYIQEPMYYLVRAEIK